MRSAPSRSHAPRCRRASIAPPIAFLDEPAFEIRLLCDHRTDLVAERTRHQNRLRWHLVELDAELEAGLPTRALDPRMLAGPDRPPAGGDDADGAGSRGPRRAATHPRADPRRTRA